MAHVWHIIPQNFVTMNPATCYKQPFSQEDVRPEWRFNVVQQQFCVSFVRHSSVIKHAKTS